MSIDYGIVSRYIEGAPDGKSVHQNSFESGTISLTKSSVTWSSGHSEDLFYQGKIQIRHPKFGIVNQYSWSRPDNIGKTYISVIEKDGTPVELATRSIDAYMAGDKIRKGHVVTIYLAADSSTIGFRN